jgi:single-stranded-DNA-specific exonuclease
LKTFSKWVVPKHKNLTEELVEAAGSKFIANLLLNREISSPEKVKAFLNFDYETITPPEKFDEIPKAVERIAQAVEKQEHIVIYGDFDADGITSTTLLYKTLKKIGADASYYIPDRSDEGHGMNSASICKIISSRKAKLIITVDCGINDIGEINLAKNFGTDIIITDHHQPGEAIPNAYAAINPKLLKDANGVKDLAGVGVAFKLACAVLKHFNIEEFEKELLPLVAIGTIADVAPLVEENRILVWHGLKLISRIKPLGLMKLLESAGYKTDKDITTEDIAFGIAPRINAVGRLSDAGEAVELLLTDDDKTAEELANKLSHNNRLRQQMCETTFKEAEDKITAEVDLDNDKVVILADKNWHEGIVGIVASKIVEKYSRPAFMICLDEENNLAKCSSRSNDGLNLYETLCEFKDYFERYGGHSLAAGFCLDMSKKNFNEFVKELKDYVNKKLKATELDPELIIDGIITPQELTPELIEEIRKLAPFGEGNRYPIFAVKNLCLKHFKTMGSANNHLKIHFTDKDENVYDAVWWQRSSIDFALSDCTDIAFSPELNYFGGKEKVQLILKDIKPAKEKSENNTEKQQQEINKASKETSFSPKWVDHRKRTGIERIFTNYIKTSGSEVSIFAENRLSLENLEKNSVLKTKLINRLNSNKTDQLVFYDLPPDNKVFSEIVKNCRAKIIHMTCSEYNGNNPLEIVKIISGMLKYAHNNKDGKVLINEIAIRLHSSEDVVNSCIALLSGVKVISLKNKSQEAVSFEFNNGINSSSIVNLPEYTDFCEKIKAMEVFRKTLAQADMKEIQNLISV